MYFFSQECQHLSKRSSYLNMVLALINTTKSSLAFVNVCKVIIMMWMLFFARLSKNNLVFFQFDYSDQRKNPKCRVSSYFHSSFYGIFSPCVITVMWKYQETRNIGFQPWPDYSLHYEKNKETKTNYRVVWLIILLCTCVHFQCTLYLHLLHIKCIIYNKYMIYVICILYTFVIVAVIK